MQLVNIFIIKIIKSSNNTKQQPKTTFPAGHVIKGHI